ncbi:MAG: ABC transporter permease, partial [Wenzhouxiangellaceae bacterium]|nr:ABC transporter permease [Wenzhouxiangellaceae bacterium]
AVPLSLGDSWRGFRVVATTSELFAHYRYAGGEPLRFAAGDEFSRLFDVVVGARVAREAELATGDELVLAHGGGNVSLNRHDALPFTVSGALAATGTPVDRALFISLDAQQAIHVGWERGVPEPGRTLTREQAQARVHGVDHDHASDHAGDAADGSAGPEISAFLLGLKTRAAALGLQYRINQRDGEPLLAILPGLALQQLWRITELAEQILRVVSALVVLAGLLGMLTALLATLGERRREMAILRACGARPWQIAWLLLIEAGAIALIGIVAGLAVAYLAQWALAPWLLERFGVAVSFAWPAPWQWAVLAAVWVAGVLVALVPAAMAYRRTVAAGMQVRQ